MKKTFITLFLSLVLMVPSFAQNTSKSEKLIFTPVVENKATSVKNQASSGTCWCFATISLLESELLRMGKGEYDLSEMFVVRNNYVDKLKNNYIRRGSGNLGQGSFAHDVIRVLKNKGIVPDEVYTGLNYGSPTHSHSEMQSFIDAVGGVAVKLKRESDQYNQIVNSILDAYLGEYPSQFTYKGVSYTPQSFANSLGLNPDDYVEITSYTHWPFYEMGVLEVPDNWTMNSFYNVPIDELVEIADYALQNGYTFSWDADVSEPGFLHANGVAQLLPSNYVAPAENNEAIRVEEVIATQKYRQDTFENFTTTDDHLMHITGIAKDQFGKKYYKVKNSWGTERNNLGGYLYASENYFRGKTVSILINKNAIPPAIRKKLGL